MALHSMPKQAFPCEGCMTQRTRHEYLAFIVPLRRIIFLLFFLQAYWSPSSDKEFLEVIFTKIDTLLEIHNGGSCDLNIHNAEWLVYYRRTNTTGQAAQVDAGSSLKQIVSSLTILEKRSQRLLFSTLPKLSVYHSRVQTSGGSDPFSLHMSIELFKKAMLHLFYNQLLTETCHGRLQIDVRKQFCRCQQRIQILISIGKSQLITASLYFFNECITSSARSITWTFSAHLIGQNFMGNFSFSPAIARYTAGES